MTLVTDADHREYHEAVLKLIQRLLLRPNPPELWHYTSGEALIKILQTGTLRSTQVSCLSDATEFRYAVKLARGAFKRRLDRDASITGDRRAILEHIHTQLAEDGAEVVNYFVACLSEKRDDLSQWRAYGSGEGGYAIRFDVDALAASAAPTVAGLAPVTYAVATQNLVADQVVDLTISFFEAGLATRPGVDRATWTNDFLEAWREANTYIAPLLKDDAFEAEAEWRLIHRLNPSDVGSMAFQQRQSMLTRHLPLRLTPPAGASWKRLPIAEIMTGPSRHQLQSRIGVGDMLRTYEYAIPINLSLSRAPYQLL